MKYSEDMVPAFMVGMLTTLTQNKQLLPCEVIHAWVETFFEMPKVVEGVAELKRSFMRGAVKTVYSRLDKECKSLKGDVDTCTPVEHFQAYLLALEKVCKADSKVNEKIKHAIRTIRLTQSYKQAYPN